PRATRWSQRPPEGPQARAGPAGIARAPTPRPTVARSYRASPCALAWICSFPAMANDADEGRALEVEARLFARYLVGRPAPAGRRVVLLDYGNQDRRYAALIPHQPFSEVRRTDAQQHRYFLGDHFEGIPLGPVRVGAQLTPPRLHILADAAERMPVHTDGFAASMSLARGGLGAGWSAGVFPFTDDELRDMGLGFDELRPHYDAVTERIGVCGAGDDLEAFLPPSPSMMPPLELDSNAEVVLTRYQRRRAALNAAAFFLGRTRLAACTERHRERGPYAYLDLDYWADPDRSVYRPQWTLEELQRAPNFTYLDRRFVRTFSEDERGVRVHATRADTGEEETHEGAALVLAGGTLGTARIVLASL